MFWFCMIFLILKVSFVSSLENGLARLPPMGWMSWGYFMCNVDCPKNPDKCLNEKLITSVADAFLEQGYKDVGYEYIIIDDCWSVKHRDKDDRLVPNKKRFPRGMKYLADYIHSKGLKFGMYSNAGPKTCMNYPGSQGHLQIDAITFAEWEVDYIKFDGCFVGPEYLNQVYIDFGKALNKTGRPIVYSCSWPYYIEFIFHEIPDFEGVKNNCNLWRNFHDITFERENAWRSVKSIINYYAFNHDRMTGLSGPGHWNDPDMVIVGTDALEPNEGRVQLSVWAMLSAPLLLSCNMKTIGDGEKRMLQNLELIAIDQDPLGVSAQRYNYPDPNVVIWVKKQSTMIGNSFHKYSIAFVNTGDNPVTIQVNLKRFGFGKADKYEIMDVWKEKFVQNVTVNDMLELNVGGKDVILYTFYPRWGNSGRGPVTV